LDLKWFTSKKTSGEYGESLGKKRICKPRFVLVSYSYLLKNERVAASNVGWVLGHQWRDRHNTLAGFSADFCMAAAGCVAVFVEVGPICFN